MVENRMISCKRFRFCVNDFNNSEMCLDRLSSLSISTPKTTSGDHLNEDGITKFYSLLGARYE